MYYTQYNIFIYVYMHVDVQKDLLDSAPFQVDDKRRCHGSRVQKQATGLQPRCSKQTTAFWEYSPSMNTYDSAHPKFIKWSKIKNKKKNEFYFGHEHTWKAALFSGSKKRPTMVFVIELFSELRRTSAELSVRSLDINRRFFWAEVWDEDSSRSPEITGEQWRTVLE